MCRYAGVWPVLAAPAGPGHAGDVIIDTAVYEQGTRVPSTAPLEEALATCRASPGSFIWIGLYEPTVAEFAQVADEFDLHPLAIEDSVHPHRRPKVEVYGENVFVVLRTAIYVDPDEVVELGELMLFVGTGFLVTVRHGDHTGLADVRRQLEAEPDRLAHGPSAVLHAVFQLVVDEYDAVLENLDVDIDQIEGEVFSGERIDRAARIFKLKREILDFRRAVRPLGESLTALAEGRIPYVPARLHPWFRDVYDHVLRVADRLDGLDSILSSALAANLAQVGVRQNEDMRKISAWAAIAAVPTMVAGVYGMNFRHIPELEWRYGYPLVLVLLLVACTGLYRMFRRRGWL
jgi:magnesium transporter